MDEFLVVMDGSPDLPSLLREYEGYGGLAVNWRMFGSSERLAVPSSAANVLARIHLAAGRKDRQ